MRGLLASKPRTTGRCVWCEARTRNPTRAEDMQSSLHKRTAFSLLTRHCINRSLLACAASPQKAHGTATARLHKMATPRLLAFDLDATLWVPEMYELHGGAPFRRDANGRVYDSSGTQIKLMGAAAEVLRELAVDPKWRETQIAYVSRTEYPEWAIPCLQTILLADGISMFDISHHREIYPGSKTTHFKRIHAASGIDYADMVFYDNERWNITECSPLGITCVYTPQGLTRRAWEEGLQKHASRK